MFKKLLLSTFVIGSAVGMDIPGLKSVSFKLNGTKQEYKITDNNREEVEKLLKFLSNPEKKPVSKYDIFSTMSNSTPPVEQKPLVFDIRCNVTLIFPDGQKDTTSFDERNQIYSVYSHINDSLRYPKSFELKSSGRKIMGNNVLKTFGKEVTFHVCDISDNDDNYPW